MAAHHLDPSERDHAHAAAPADLEEFARRGQAAQHAVDELGAGAPSYWWLVRLRVEPTARPFERPLPTAAVHVERVCAPDSREACKLASRAAGEKWPGHTFYVIDLVQEGL